MKRALLAAALATTSFYAAPASAGVVLTSGTVAANGVDYVSFSHSGGFLSILTVGYLFGANTPLGDPMISLFANNGSPIGALTGTLLGTDDDTIGSNPVLTFASLASGNYILAVGAFNLTETEARSGIASTPDVAQDYAASFTTLHTDVVIGGAVPEPATWAMMLAGFGLVGASMRRRAPKVTVTYA